MLQHVTGVDHGRWIDCYVSFVNVANDSVFIDQKRGAIAEALLLVKDAVILHDSAFEIAEKRKRDAKLFGEFLVSGDAVDTEAKNLRVGGFEFCDISLIRFKFLRSTTGERQYINREYDVLLAFEIAEFVGLSVSGAKREIRSRIADLQIRLWGRLLGQRYSANHREQHETY
jgi:hypothetical protein